MTSLSIYTQNPLVPYFYSLKSPFIKMKKHNKKKAKLACVSWRYQSRKFAGAAGDTHEAVQAW